MFFECRNTQGFSLKTIQFSCTGFPLLNGPKFTRVCKPLVWLYKHLCNKTMFNMSISTVMLSTLGTKTKQKTDINYVKNLLTLRNKNATYFIKCVLHIIIIIRQKQGKYCVNVHFKSFIWVVCRKNAPFKIICRCHSKRRIAANPSFGMTPMLFVICSINLYHKKDWWGPAQLDKNIFVAHASFHFCINGRK